MNRVISQVVPLVVLAIPTSWMTWVWTKEEVFREPQEWLKGKKREHEGKNDRTFALYKACYMLTCETCFSHYPAMFFVWYLGLELLAGGFTGWFLAVMFTAACENIILTRYGTARVEKRAKEEDEREVQTRRKIEEKELAVPGRSL